MIDKAIQTGKRPVCSALVAMMSLVVAFFALSGCGPQATPVPHVPPTETAVPTPAFTPTPTATPTPTPTPTPDPTFPMKTTHFSFGVNVDLYYREGVGRPAEEVMGFVDELGMEWVRIQASWADMEPAKGTYVWDALDSIVDVVGKHNRKLLVSLVRSPAWATADGGYGMPADPLDLGEFLSAMATRYQGRIQAYEIWNEQNYAVENDGYVQGAGRYVELLKVAYYSIKSADPYAIVLFGPLTPTGVNDPTIAIDDLIYLEEVYQYNDGEVRGYFDVLAAHVAGTLNPPDRLWPDKPGDGPGWVDHSSHYFRQVEKLRAVMEAYGDGDKQIWITEFGWASLDGIADTAAPGYEYAYYNSAHAQADYTVWALDIGRTQYQPWMGAMFVWNLNFATIVPGTDEKAPFSMLRPDYGTRPVYRAVKSYIEEHSQWP